MNRQWCTEIEAEIEALKNGRPRPKKGAVAPDTDEALALLRQRFDEFERRLSSAEGAIQTKLEAAAGDGKISDGETEISLSNLTDLHSSLETAMEQVRERMEKLEAGFLKIIEFVDRHVKRKGNQGIPGSDAVEKGRTAAAAAARRQKKR